MGHCCGKASVATQNQMTLGYLKTALDGGALADIQRWLDSMGKDSSILNTAFLPVQAERLTPLSYALCLGFVDAFELLRVNGANTEVMCTELQQLGMRPLDIICQKGHHEFLVYYLPLYLTIEEGGPSIVAVDESEEISIFMNQKQTNLKARACLLPIHELCLNGSLDSVKFVTEYFNGPPPADLDVHSVDERGNNGALYSLQSGVFELVEYLHQVCRADFHLVNKMNENAVVLAAAGSKRQFERPYYKIFRYLVETVQVNYLHNYEETLLILENQTIITYFEAKLLEKGISVTKAALEATENMTSHEPVPEGPRLHGRISLVEAIRKECAQPEMSSISHQHSLNNSSIGGPIPLT